MSASRMRERCVQSGNRACSMHLNSSGSCVKSLLSIGGASHFEQVLPICLGTIT